MTTELWIVVAVVLALIAVALIVGAVLYRRRRITLTKPPEVDSKGKSGGYQAKGGFSFSQGASSDSPTALKEPPAKPQPPTTHPVTSAPGGERTDTDGQPHVGDDASVPRDAVKRPIRDVEIPDAVEPLETKEPAPALERPEDPELLEELAAPVEEVPVLDEIDPSEGRLDRLRGRLARSQNAVGKSLLGLLGGGDLDEESWEEVEDTLLIADLGSATTTMVVDRLREQMVARSVRTESDARALLREVLIDALRPELDRSIHALPHDDTPSVLLVVGVNGTGKTTTTGKLARVLIADGRRVLLGAADTFRAAAADQLQTWAERVGAEVVRGKESADPASVAFDAVTRGIEAGVDTVLIDTAGRLHTKTGLMDELGKVKRVVEKRTKVDEVLLVLDATVGQNGLNQAKVFSEVVDITGVVLTKLDGTAKGGIVFQVQHQLGVPVKLVGLGEGADDLAPFEPAAFVDALL
ncbi:signal recognition particle-docking protein FtsY [Hoyosella rhizosphaerae]|uniref:Signal recognition particle receptor FtsY n=1 Tax=Hoyosella rhizosphaerae TaxID=1755582 RepID=A0A916U538_9ACTN|nr:signal recognition particle-docking protein FtsY [Hoyosella rhizosphaerae]MBN4926229.1 signal recognition particle-docking protein FtsY [Hoyosella rhizosphaerae]GGC61058.1 signal recognition particle receptor FtsY [Hoyosella rhizosphaerae]